MIRPNRSFATISITAERNAEDALHCTVRFRPLQPNSVLHGPDAPRMPFELFRQLGGNFYTNIVASVGEILGFVTVR